MIIKGTVCIKVDKEELGHIPVNYRVCYDGDYFGEIAHFEASEKLKPEVLEELNRQRATTIAMEETYALQMNKALANKVIN